MRGWMLKPSSVLSTATSAQSDGRVAQSGCGRVDAQAGDLAWSSTVSRLLGNGCPAVVVARAPPGKRSANNTAAVKERMGTSLLCPLGEAATLPLTDSACQRNFGRVRVR